MANGHFTNMTNEQLIVLIPLLYAGGDWEITFPTQQGEDLVVKLAIADTTWTVTADGTTTQGSYQ